MCRTNSNYRNKIFVSTEQIIQTAYVEQILPTTRTKYLYASKNLYELSDKYEYVSNKFYKLPEQIKFVYVKQILQTNRIKYFYVPNKLYKPLE
jgi:hypothetical protein